MDSQGNDNQWTSNRKHIANEMSVNEQLLGNEFADDEWTNDEQWGNH